MIITFKNNKLEKAFNEGRQLEATYGQRRASKIRLRMKEFRAAVTLADFLPPKSPPSRCHELGKGQRVGQLSVDLDHPYRLIFTPDHDPVPVLNDGGLDWTQVNAVKILGIEDTHD